MRTLMERYGLSERQACRVIEMQARRQEYDQTARDLQGEPASQAYRDAADCIWTAASALVRQDEVNCELWLDRAAQHLSTLAAVTA